jgi:multidrug efflux pump subunit AcrB
LRAVILTSLTTLAGIIPLAYGIGGTDFILKPMALSLGYGLPSLKNHSQSHLPTPKCLTMQRNMQSFLKAFVFAIFVIFFLLILLFDSYTQPLLVHQQYDGY